MSSVVSWSRMWKCLYQLLAELQINLIQDLKNITICALLKIQVYLWSSATVIFNLLQNHQIFFRNAIRTQKVIHHSTSLRGRHKLQHSILHGSFPWKQTHKSMPHFPLERLDQLLTILIQNKAVFMP